MNQNLYKQLKNFNKCTKILRQVYGIKMEMVEIQSHYIVNINIH